MGRPLGSRYVLDDQLGIGGMGEVWRGHTHDGDRVAVKVLRAELTRDQELVGRFVQERAVLIRVQHRNVVHVLDLVAEGDTIAIVMDLVDGHDLRAEIALRQTMRPADALSLMAQVFDGLAAVHAASVVHRDLKPENILLDLTAGGRLPKVTDFGVSRLLSHTRLTRQTSIIGTPEYMAPEQADGQDVTPAADLYAAGIVLYELLTGVTPFTGAHPVAILRRHLDQLPGRPAGVPDPLWDFIATLLSKDPKRRGRSAGAAAQHARLLAGQLASAPGLPPLTEPPATQPLPAVAATPAAPTVKAAPVGTPPKQNAPARTGRRRIRAAAVAALVLAAGIVTAIIVSGSSKPKPSAAATTPTPSSTPSATTSPTPTPSVTPTVSDSSSAGPAGIDTSVRNSGKIVLYPGNTVDLDSRLANWSEDTSNAPDLQMQSDGSLASYGSGKIIPLTQTTPAGYQDCASATGIVDMVDRSNIKKGQQYCVSTSEGRLAVLTIASFQYAQINSQDLSQIVVQATSWEQAASPNPTSNTISFPSNPAIRNSGAAKLNDGNSLDLDSRQPNWGENSSSGTDIGLDFEGNLQAQSQALLIPLNGSAAGTFAGCTSATGVVSTVAFNDLAVGQRYCILTDESRYALVTVSQVVPQSNGSTGLAEVDLSVTSWDFQALPSS